jgi:hypothetical protein
MACALGSRGPEKVDDWPLKVGWDKLAPASVGLSGEKLPPLAGVKQEKTPAHDALERLASGGSGG